MFRVSVEPPKVKSKTIQRLIVGSDELKGFRPQEAWRISSRLMFEKSESILLKKANDLGVFAKRDRMQMVRLIKASSIAIARQARTRLDIITIQYLDSIFARMENLEEKAKRTERKMISR